MGIDFELTAALQRVKTAKKKMEEGTDSKKSKCPGLANPGHLDFFENLSQKAEKSLTLALGWPILKLQGTLLALRAMKWASVLNSLLHCNAQKR